MGAYRALVHWCFLVDTVHSSMALWVLWRYSVDNFMNFDFLATTLWPVSASPLFVGACPLSPVHPKTLLPASC